MAAVGVTIFTTAWWLLKGRHRSQRSRAPPARSGGSSDCIDPFEAACERVAGAKHLGNDQVRQAGLPWGPALVVLMGTHVCTCLCMAWHAPGEGSAKGNWRRVRLEVSLT